MKKIAPFVILFLFALLAWNLFGHTSGMTFDIDGEESAARWAPCWDCCLPAAA